MIVSDTTCSKAAKLHPPSQADRTSSAAPRERELREATWQAARLAGLPKTGALGVSDREGDDEGAYDSMKGEGIAQGGC